MISIISFLKKFFIKEECRNVMLYPEVLNDVKTIMKSDKFAEVIKDNLHFPQLLYEDNCALIMTSYLMDNYYAGKYKKLFSSKIDAENVLSTVYQYDQFITYIKNAFISNIENNISEMDKECKDIEDFNKSFGDDRGVDEIFHPAQAPEESYSEYDGIVDISLEDIKNTGTIEEE